MLQAFPLQHKRMRRLVLPFISVGVCEVMNCATSDQMSSFVVHNARNRGALPAIPEAVASPSLPFMSEAAVGGLCDSFTGPQCSAFVGNYLARALGMHSVLPEGIAQLRRELKDDPIIDLMTSSLARGRTLYTKKSACDMKKSPLARRIFSEWEMQQYAMFADNAFVDACRGGKLADALKENDMSLDDEAANSGCRAVWFTATVAPFALDGEGRQIEGGDVPHKDATPSFCLDVLVSNVGDSRAFGLARNPLTWGVRSTLDVSREVLVPLSADHKPLRTPELCRILRAGGVVRSDVGDIIDGNPFYNVSRSFGHWSMKCNAKRPPSEQKLIALPTCSSWEMLPGDVLVLCNHATFETRCQEESSMDEAAKVVGRALDRGASTEEAAGELCDYAIRFGAGHSLQVMVAVATANETSGANSGARREEWVVPGPIYVEPCRRLSAYREALQADCKRCGLTLAELLRLRWYRVRDLLPSRHALPLMAYYGRECSALQQIMDEEALLFSHESLLSSGRRDDDDASLTARDRVCTTEIFEKMAKTLMTSNFSLVG